MAVEAHFNAKTVWCSEFDKHASKVIETRLGITNYGDLKKIDWASIEPVDIITAGYPCQPFSHAGHRKGTDDPRHLFPYILQAISIIRPSIVILENVRGHLNLGFSEVLGHLASIGYSAKWRTIRAADIGACHARERLFILAYPDGGGPGSLSRGDGLAKPKCRDDSNSFNDYSHNSSQTDLLPDSILSEWQGSDTPQPNMPMRSSSFDWGNSPYAAAIRRWESITRLAPEPLVNHNKLNPEFVEWMMGLPYGWVTGVDIPRSQKLKILGNGVVPQQAYEAIRLLLNQEMTTYQPNLFSHV